MTAAHAAADLHDAQRMRRAGRDLLSLALIESRNRTLAWLGLFDDAPAPQPQPAEAFEPAPWLAGHAGWFQERRIARNLHRFRGAATDTSHSPLASVEPDADAYWDPAASTAVQRWQTELPDADQVRAYLGETLEATLDLLAQVDDADDEAMHWFRAALWHEDALVERFGALAQGCGVAGAQALAGPQPARSLRDALWFPAQRARIGSPPGQGFVPEAERWSHEVLLPEFEIDAQPVSWAQYSEFVEDGGYDDSRWWSLEGAAWLAAGARRCPRDVEQVRHGVLLHRFGRLQHASAAQAVVHVSAHEAQAWCRWAGRRLATEVEWELAAVAGRSRGFVFGDIAEWTAGRAQAWPGGEPRQGVEGDRALRGCAWFASPRQAHPRARRFLAAQRDEGFTGFRSCAI